jgi:serine/threonine-protein kinase
LQHPNIVQIHEIGEHDGLPYFSLEYVDGGSLAERLKDAPPSDMETAQLVELLARTVHYAHGRGIVHRDLKLVNILLTRDGIPKIADFGLAKSLGEDSGQTRSGAILGTPSYMAPEQASGKSGAIGPAVDVYALGAILYELLTGRPPLRGETVLETLRLV